MIIGNFDGCHRGHQVLLKRGRTLAESHQLSSLCLTFEPNPRQFFKPELAVGKLFQAQQKLRALDELGINWVVIQDFDQKFSSLSPEEFFVHLLKEELAARAIIVGHDFHFGKQRLGTIETLGYLASQYGVDLVPIEPENFGSGIISSSRIRQALREGNLAEAEALLGRPYLIEGEVVEGKKLGRQLGFPTANIKTQDQLLPDLGVYAGYAVVDRAPPIFHIPQDIMPCVLNIGRRPTVDSQGTSISTEVHILSEGIGSEALYGSTLGVYLKHFIRGEQHFSSLETLKNQIKKDCQKAHALLTAPDKSPSNY